MSVRGVLIKSDSSDSLTEYSIDLQSAPRSPRTPRSPHMFVNRVDYFDRGHKGM